MEETRILVLRPKAYAPLDGIPPLCFDAVVYVPTGDELGPRRIPADALPTQARFLRPNDDIEMYNVAFPTSVPYAIASLVDRTPSELVATEIAKDPEPAWLRWQTNAGGKCECATSTAIYSSTELLARTLCVQLRTKCVEERLHSHAEERRLQEMVLFGALQIDSDNGVKFWYDHIVQGAIETSTISALVGPIPREKGADSFKCLLPTRYLVPTAIRPDVGGTSGHDCAVRVYTEVATLQYLYHIFSYLYDFLPMSHPLLRGGWERSLEKRCEKAPHSWVATRGPMWYRILYLASCMSGAQTLPQPPEDEWDINAILRYLRGTCIFAAVLSGSADMNELMCFHYYSVVAVISSVPGHRILALPIPLTSVRNGEVVTTITKVGGRHHPSYTIRRHLLQRDCEVYQAQGQYKQAAREGVKKLVKHWPDKVYSPVLGFASFLRDDNLVRYLLGRLCAGSVEILSFFIPYRNPLKSFVCIYVYPHDVPEGDVKAIAQRRLAKVQRFCKGEVHLQLHSDIQRTTISSSGDVRALVMPYDWMRVSGISISVRLPSYTREMGDFAGKLTRHRF
ncbi:outer capsid protein [Mono Lake orbivirus]|nr:outer capsid protein [Mono Lake orbivirus]